MGITAFLVERNTPGLTIGKGLEKMGLRGSPMAEVFFDNCEIPVTQRLGREGRGAGVFECAMEWETGLHSGQLPGRHAPPIGAVIRHAQTRKQFGKPIGKYQSVANRIVDMKLRLDTCQPLVYRIGQLKQLGKPAALEAAVGQTSCVGVLREIVPGRYSDAWAAMAI